MKQIINLGIWILSIQNIASAQDTTMMSLQAILERIDSNNILLKSYDLKARSYQFSAEASTAWMAPMVGAGTFMYPYSKPMDDRDKGSFMIKLEQEIPNPHKQKAKKSFIQSKGEIDLAERVITLNDLKAMGKKLYYNWVVAEKKRGILEKNERILETMKKIEEVRYPYNQSLLGNIFRAEAQIEQNRNMLIMLEGEINKSRAILNSLMNERGDFVFTIDTTSLPEFKTNLHDTAFLSSLRGDIKKMDVSIQSMALNIQSMKLERKPDFRVSYDHMTPRASMMPNAFSIMAMVSIPIAPWASKMYRNDIKAMELTIDAMQNERSAMLQETQGMLYGMQYEIISMQARINAMEVKILPALQKAFDVNYLSYQENKLPLTTLIGDWEALSMMQVNIADEKAKLYQMIVDYEREIYK
ncbi:TolC family protein [Flavihumibacter sp. ZG627]|uniref:TolC family protein n=1 Tax=Flavihumibacter sp. ZG627 TaxID=1463156 RepID=UPI00057E7803|nr:TolC family protein [Flavihumibacter sp. ZG627]KIC90427.1 membrane protein [Flavihumibacter sp. ZG627]